MKTNFIKILSILLVFLANISLFSLIFNGCQYSSPEGEYMRPLIELRNEINELEKRKKRDEIDLKKERKMNKQKRDSLMLFGKEIDSLEILIKEFEKK